MSCSQGSDPGVTSNGRDGEAVGSTPHWLMLPSPGLGQSPTRPSCHPLQPPAATEDRARASPVDFSQLSTGGGPAGTQPGLPRLLGVQLHQQCPICHLCSLVNE